MDSNKTSLEGKVALITGGGTGIGKVMAITLAEAGADVVVASRRMEPLEECAREIKAIGRRSCAIQADVTKSAEVTRMVEQAISLMGKIDILINNAGIVRDVPRGQPIWDITDDMFYLQINTNMTGAFFGSRAIAKYFADRKSGKIINVSSELALRGAPNGYMYCMAKAGVIELTRCLALSLAQYNVQVNCILPGMTQVHEFQPPLKPGEKSRMIGIPPVVIPMGRFGQPSDIADIALFLASEASDYITGELFNGDGGRLAGGFGPTGYTPVLAMEEV